MNQKMDVEAWLSAAVVEREATGGGGLTGMRWWWSEVCEVVIK